jgi:glycosyltransferase involved in cell wall biosynthesis
MSTPLRVLYAVFHPLPVSESYIYNEIEWMEKRGVEIALWARHPRLAAGDLRENRRYWIGKPREIRKAIRAFKPAVVHAHPMFIAEMVADEVERSGLPLTARGHVGFGGQEKEDLKAIRGFASRGVVSRIWAFPHVAADIAHPKLTALPACYASEFFLPGKPSESRYVLRIGTCLPGKGWEEFLEVARHCPKIPFVAALAVPNKAYADELVAVAPKNLRVHRDLQREACVKLMQGAWVYLRGHDPKSHRYGMPISIAEALGCGLPVIARSEPEAHDYIGGSGQFYDTVEGAAQLVQGTIAWSRSEWSRARVAALQDATRYTADANLPQVLAHWRDLAAAGSRRPVRKFLGAVRAAGAKLRIPFG